MISRSDGNGLEVNGFDDMRKQRALNAENVPTENLVGAGHREQAISGHDTVPRLKRDRRIDGNRAHSTLYL